MKIFAQSFLILAVLTLLTGVAYPAGVWAIAQLAWSDKANGSLILDGESVRGSELLAQKFESERYFFARPSASDYNPVPSSATNLGPTSHVLKNLIARRRAEIAKRHNVPENQVPVELITSSASGLDPHLSVEGVYFQVDRVARARGMSAEQRNKLEVLIHQMTQGAQWAMFGDARVNVLLLNRALDRI